MRFCQTDGTPLVDAAPVDPYKTMVARPDEIAAAIPSSPAAGESSSRDEDVLDLPNQNDPRKTMFASEDEIRREMSGGQGQEEQVIDIPPLTDMAPVPPPKFNPPPSTPPPSPFDEPRADVSTPWSEPESAVSSSSGNAASGSLTTPPIPSPFPEPKRSEPENEPPPFKEPEPSFEPALNPFDQPSAQSDWTPPPAPMSGGQGDFGISPTAGGQSMSAPPPPVAGEGQNKTLPIVSLILGILSLCCYVSPLTGIGALITGFLGLKNINANPAQYGGKPLAITGMVLGGLFFLIGLLYWVFILFFGGLAMMMENMPR